MENEKSMKNFMILWSGQFVSIIGSSLSAFGLSMWILENTKSTMTFALTFFLQILPRIIFAMPAGSMADRVNRKKIMISMDSLDALVKAILVVLIINDMLSMPAIYVSMFLSSTLSTFQGPALNAAIPQIVPKNQIARANGLFQFIPGVQGIVAPLISALFYPIIGVVGLFAIDFITYGFAIVTVLMQKIPNPQIKEEEKGTSVFQDAKFAYGYLRERKGLITLMVIFSFLNFFANLVMVPVAPMVVAENGVQSYGFVNTASGVGMLLGGFFAGAFPAKNNKIKRIGLFLILTSVGLAMMGISKNWIITAIGFFIFMFPVPYANGTLGGFIQLKIPNEILGRVGALMNIMLQGTTPIAILLAGFLSDKIFIPLLKEGGSLDNTIVSDLIGTGDVRGIGLMFVLSGIALFLTCMALLLNPSVMTLEERLPDID